MASFKIFFPDESIRRFRCENFPSFDAFVCLLSSLYPTAYHPEMKLQYQDSDGDKCTLSTEIEWTEMRQEISQQGVVKIWVAEGSGTYFKDGPPPELVTVYSDPTNPKPEPSADNWSSLHDRVTRSLANLFPGGKILPLNLPSFLEGIVLLKPRDDNLVDLDVDISRLASVLGKRAYDLLDESSKAALHEAKSCLLSQLILYPTDCIAHYNLACAEALLDNIAGALVSLEKSIQNGYGNVRHMTCDPDLKSLQGLPKFQELVELAKVGVVQEFKEEKPVPTHPQPEPALPEIVPEIKTEPQPEPKVAVPEPTVAVPEPTVPVTLEPKKWEAEIKVLADMGFLDESILVQTLDKTGGDVTQALTVLLD